ncbi:hypothetical protein RCO28_21920 [Streptomyces sp. LHD-70]|uniref:hypothetical protein n=1 Tax=Streptomyces sp. LHD-70 TaxID=3072140 RepID=UPI00280DE77D|nr:hypothetical protein [Streptomyces sp. LHD-70]MDQ8705131.1 hypothetical protein [Streptomyces sp. LHD-70]
MNDVRIPPPAQAPPAEHQATPCMRVQAVGIDDIILSYSSEHWLGPWHDDSVQRWDIGMHFNDEGPGPCFGTIELYVVDHWRSPNIVESLDALSVDLCEIGTALYDPEQGHLRNELYEHLALPGKTTIVDRVRMDRRFRGQGLGIYLTGLALDYLSHGAGVFALFPGPLEDDDAPVPPPGSWEKADEAALTTARTRLGLAWSRLGFKHYRKGTWILDPGMRTLHDALRREQQRLHGHSWNVTFSDVATSGAVVSAGIEKVTMAKSAPHPLRSGGIEGS